MHASGSFCGGKKKLKHLGPRLSEQIELAAGLWLPSPASDSFKSNNKQSIRATQHAQRV